MIDWILSKWRSDEYKKALDEFEALEREEKRKRYAARAKIRKKRESLWVSQYLLARRGPLYDHMTPLVSVDPITGKEVEPETEESEESEELEELGTFKL
ncbi:hypothetical protein ACPV5S_20110 [Vibrio astriarenae]